MEESKKVVYLEDGRKAEKIVQEEGLDTGETKVVTEVWAEPKITNKLTQRVVEYKKPVIHRREIETVDESTGEVLQRTVESLNPEVKMELREHIQVASVSAQSIDDCDCHVTKEEMQNTFAEGFKVIAMAMQGNSSTSSKSVSALQAIVGEKVENKQSDSMAVILCVAIAILSGIAIYAGFLM